VVERLPRKCKALGSVPSSEKKNQKKKKKDPGAGSGLSGMWEHILVFGTISTSTGWTLLCLIKESAVWGNVLWAELLSA